MDTAPSGAADQAAVEIDGDIGEGAGLAEGAVEADDAGIGSGGVGAGGVAFEAEMPVERLGEPEGEVGVGEGDGHLFGTHFEVDAGGGSGDVREAGGGAAVALGGGGGGHAGGLDEDGFEVPAAVGEVNEVDGGGIEGDARELDAAGARGSSSGG